MDLYTFEPTFVIQIKGQGLLADLTDEITVFVFEDNEEELEGDSLDAPLCFSGPTAGGLQPGSVQSR